MQAFDTSESDERNRVSLALARAFFNRFTRNNFNIYIGKFHTVSCVPKVT